MRIRAKVLTVATAMVTTFAVLPTLGAAAAEPLADGSYPVTVGEATYTVEVLDGLPRVQSVEGVDFTFAFDEATGRVLDEFDLTVGDTEYDVAVSDDGTATVIEGADEDDENDGSGSDGVTASTTDSTDDGATEDDESGEDDTEDEGTQDSGSREDAGTDEGEDADDGAHGELVAAVAQCAPSGRVARDAGLPNHGFFASAAARGESVEFDLDGETLTADLATPEGTGAFCALATELVDAAGDAAADEGDDASTDDDVDPSDTEADTEQSGRSAAEGRTRGKGRSEDARGRSGDAPGRSGDAPGRAKKGR